MKMNRIIIFLVAVSGIMVSCNKWLEQSPISSITSGSFWKTSDDAAGVLNGMYLEARAFCSYNLMTWGETRSDMYAGGVAGNYWNVYYNNTISPSDPGPNWYNIYRTINYANLLLKYVPDLSYAVEAEKNSVLAQAYTMRAWCYFIITRTWGDAIVITDPMEEYSPDKVYRPRLPKTEVFALIKNDLDEALKLFPDNNLPAGRYYWSKTGANVLKGDVYLWTAKTMNGGDDDLQTALDALNQIQPTTTLYLLDDYLNVFSFTNKGNNEVIMVSRFDAPPEASDNAYAYLYINTNPGFTPEELAFISPIGAGNTGVNIAQIRQEVRDQFTLDDQRRNSFYEIFNADGGFVTSVNIKGRGYNDGGTRRFADDIVIYRYADVLLLRAEAKSALGQDPSEEMNEIRKRAYGDKSDDYLFVNGKKADNDATILKERLLEFVTEGKRWWDLIRFDKVYDLVPAYIGQQKDARKYVFPVGLDIRSREPLVEENPGW